MCLRPTGLVGTEGIVLITAHQSLLHAESDGVTGPVILQIVELAGVVGLPRQELAMVMARLSGEVYASEGLDFSDADDVATCS